MDLSLATDPYSNAFLGHSHQYQQQQQQHNQQHHLQYHYHQVQHPQALSLAPPSGKGFYDLQSLEQAVPNSLGFASSSYQPDYGLSTFQAGAPGAPASSSAAGASFHQPRTRNADSTHAAHASGAQHSQFSPAPPAAAARMLHPSGYNAEGHTLSSGAAAGADHSLQYSSLHGWVGPEAQRSQWSQQAWDNCLPPGVEPTASSVSNSVLPSFPHTHTQLQPHSHTHLQQYPQAQFQIYRHTPQQYPSIGMNAWTAKPAHKVWPKKKPAKTAEKKIPVVKTTVMKESGAVRGSAPENGPGWCFVCQRNCLTEVALKQHLEGKAHKRKAKREKERAESAAKAVDEGGGGVTSMLEQMWVQVSMMGKSSRSGNTRRKSKVERQPRETNPTGVEPKVEPKPEGECEDAMPTAVEQKPEEGPTTKKRARSKASNARKVQETARCDLCGVECNDKAVLEIHFGGKKHKARLKKLQQESSVPCNAEQTTSVGQ